jgi:curved DNA-binding protein CbpA
MTDDLYSRLDVPRDADAKAIHKAFCRKAKKAHPDAGGSEKEFRALVLAHDVLSDERRRENYDRTGNAEDVAPDNQDAEIIAIISGALDAIMGEYEQQRIRPEATDIAMAIRNKLAQTKGQLNANITAISEGARKNEKLLKRFRRKSKDGENRMEALIVGRIAFLKGQVTFVTRQREQVEKAIALIKEYTFDADNSEAAQPMTNRDYFMQLVVAG